MTAKRREALQRVEQRHAAWANRICAGIDLQRLREAVAALSLVRQRLEEDTEAPHHRPKGARA